MHRHDCPCLRGDRGFDPGGVDVVAASVDVNQNGTRAGERDGRDSRDEGVRYGARLIMPEPTGMQVMTISRVSLVKVNRPARFTMPVTVLDASRW